MVEKGKAACVQAATQVYEGVGMVARRDAGDPKSDYIKAVCKEELPMQVNAYI